MPTDPASQILIRGKTTFSLGQKLQYICIALDNSMFGKNAPLWWTSRWSWAKTWNSIFHHSLFVDRWRSGSRPRIRTFRVTYLIRTLLHALYLINNNFRILFSRINDQKSIRVWNRKTIIIYTFENWLMLIGDLWREWQKCRRKLVRGLFLSLVSRSLNNWFKNWRKISKQSRMLAGNRGHPRALRSFSLLEAKCRGVYSSVQHISPAVCKPSKRL